MKTSDGGSGRLLLARPGRSLDVWETTYPHVLDGEDTPCCGGTALQPVLAALDPAIGPRGWQFLAECGALLRAASTPPVPPGTVLPVTADLRRRGQSVTPPRCE